MLIFYYSEILRVIDSVQLTAKYKVATPADWKVRLKIVL
jgi:alkyl hydroperoxide reductase subunit AhpC